MKTFLDNLGSLIKICKERIPEKGEDAYVYTVNEKGAMIGCFDGCGGIGSRRYSSFKMNTGAYVASRVSANTALKWFLDECSEMPVSDLSENTLKEKLREILNLCNNNEMSRSAIKGSLAKEFPTTLSVITIDSQSASFYWAGDSRGYILDGLGLHQITKDDAAQQDAMLNLREDTPLSNMISGTGNFIINKKQIKYRKKGVWVTCTDGCFAYLNSPMAFEKTLLETLEKAGNPLEWELMLSKEIEKVASDDYTLIALPWGYRSFSELKSDFKNRTLYIKGMEKEYRDNPEDWWKNYKNEYETY